MLYLSGNLHFGWTDGDIKKSLEYFDQAIERDPDFAAPYAELAISWYRLAFLGDYPPKTLLSLTRELALKALTLDSWTVPRPRRDGGVEPVTAPGTGRKPRPAAGARSS